MNTENTQMPIDMPMDNPGAIEKQEPANHLAVQLNRLMDHFNLKAIDICKKAKIPHATLGDWYNGRVGAQVLDERVKNVADMFGITLNYLVYETPMTERDFEIEAAIKRDEEKRKTA